MTADAVGGVWQYSLQLASLLAARGIRVLLAVMGPPPGAAQRAAAARTPGLTLRTNPAALEWMPGAWGDVDRAAGWLLALEHEFAPDLVHLNGYAHGTLPWRAPVLVVAHSCVSSWWHAVHGTPPPSDWDEYVKRVARGLRSATVIAAPSTAMRDALIRWYGAGHDARVIPNCCDSGVDTAPAKEPFIFAAGRVWDAAKNIAALDGVAPELQWPIYVAGETSSPGGSTRALECARSVGVISPRDVRTWMIRAAIYALPARYEPFGLSVLEAAHCGCALVLGDIPSLREHWDGVARFVHPDRPDQLRDVLQALIEDPGRREALGAAARGRAAAFSSERHAAAYVDLYREMVADHGRIAHSARPL